MDPKSKRSRRGCGRGARPQSPVDPPSPPSSLPSSQAVRRPRTRGPRCVGLGRVRVRGGRAAATETMAAAVAPNQGGASSRGRGRGGRSFHHERSVSFNIEDSDLAWDEPDAMVNLPAPPSPSALMVPTPAFLKVVPIEKLQGRSLETPSDDLARSAPAPTPAPTLAPTIVLCDINELPESHGLEVALHPKRMRMSQPPNPARRPPSPQPRLTLPSPSAPQTPSSSPSPSAPPSASPFQCSSSMFIECGTASVPASAMQHLAPPPPPPPQPDPLREDNISFLANCGSDDDSDDDDESGGVVPVMIPRAYRSLLETPLDIEEEIEDSAPATSSVPAGDWEPAHVLPEMTEKPRELFDFDWRDFPTTPIRPESRREKFSEINVGPTTPCVDPYEIFIQIWDRRIMEHIVSETNKYAQQVVSQMLENHTLHPNSRICGWRDTSVDEMYTYFGIILSMGVVVKARLEEYWTSTPDIFYTPGFSAHMPIDRFLLLNKCLHFNDNKNMCALGLESEARLFKIQPILSHLNEKFQRMYRPAQNLALDESLLMWKGWLEFSQLIPNKAANRGIKTYEICESQTGYLWRFEVHAHRKQSPQHVVDPLEASTPAIVLQLVQGLEHKGYTLWMDNYYNSPCLARRLKCLGFDCVGTLRTDRPFVPQALNSLTKHNMRQGQISGLTAGDVDVMVWRDRSRVAMISTYHGNGQQTVRGNTKPILIVDYNIMMGGVDKKDQLLAMYPIERKRTKVWYKKLFKHLLNISILNAFVIHRHSSSSPLTHRYFRYKLIRSLLSIHSPSSIPMIPSATIQKKVDVSHRVAEYPMGSHQRMRRACVACKKQVRTFCIGCSKSVCIDPCFLTIHS